MRQRGWGKALPIEWSLQEVEEEERGEGETFNYLAKRKKGGAVGCWRDVFLLWSSFIPQWRHCGFKIVDESFFFFFRLFRGGRRKPRARSHRWAAPRILSLSSQHTHTMLRIFLSLLIFLFSPPEVFVRAGCAPLLLVFLSSQKKKNLLLLQQQQFLAANCWFLPLDVGPEILFFTLPFTSPFLNHLSRFVIQSLEEKKKRGAIDTCEKIKKKY